MPFKAQRYQDGNGKVPYTNWIKKLRKKNPAAAAKVDTAVSRAMGGNFGDNKFERDGVWALRIDFGPGYRVYYSLEDGQIILLLIGGDKSSQDADIDKAVAYLTDFNARKPK